MSKNESNSWTLFHETGKIDDRANLQLVSDQKMSFGDLKTKGIAFTLPPSSVELVKIESVP